MYDSTKLLVQAVIMARIDYCNGLLYRVRAVHFSELQRLQNTASRLITFFTYTPRFHHISPVLFTLHRLSVKYRISYKIVILTFKVIRFSSPTYLRNLIQFRHNECYSLRSMHLGVLLQDPSLKFKCTLGKKAFSASALKTWNAPPANIRSQNDFNTFKTMLKTFYFREAFSSML